MLLDEDPAMLIHHTIGNFNIVPDKMAVSRINETLSQLRESRGYQIQEAEAALKKLSRQHNVLATQHAETVSAHSSTTHSSAIATLDTQKFRIAKSASDIEIETERLSSQLAELQSKLHELETQGLDGGDGSKRSLVEDEVLLRLKIYRSLGMSIEKDAETGEYAKAIVNGSKNGDVHIVNLDPKFSQYFYSNHFWSIL